MNVRSVKCYRRCRRASALGLVALLVVALLAACGQPAPASTPAPATSAAAPKPVASTAPAGASAPVATSAPPMAASPAAKPAGSAPTSIKLGAVVPLTGRYAAGGEQIKNGYELGVEAINSAGGVMVKALNAKVPLELKLLDDESDPTKTVQRLETLNSEGVIAYLGGFGSDLHAAAAAIADKN